MSPLFCPTGALIISSLLKLLLLLPIYINITPCAALPADNLQRPKPPTLAADPNTVNFHCVHSSQWRDNTRLFVGDCFDAYYMMAYSEGVDPYRPEVRKEFKTRSAPSAQPAGVAIDLPRKYVAGKFITCSVVLATKFEFDITGSCTVAILMRAEVQPGDLPAEDGRSIITNDVSSFRTITTAASVVYDMCGKSLKSPGWATVGKCAGSVCVRVGHVDG
ncbi:MAG: hypothetical protein Q9221_005675 [Calogaya cf. arnoldii]